MNKKYWLKIGKEEDIESLKNEDYQGFCYECAKFRPEKYSVKNIKKGELMIIYVRKKKEFYLSKINYIKIGKENKGRDWVHFIHLEPLYNKEYYIGKIENWNELSKNLEFPRKYENIGLALNCSMWELGKEDFARIVNFLDNKIKTY